MRAAIKEKAVRRVVPVVQLESMWQHLILIHWMTARTVPQVPYFMTPSPVLKLRVKK